MKYFKKLGLIFIISSALIVYYFSYTRSVGRSYEGSSEKLYKHDKWIVVTTINEPTEQIKKLANID
jgi:hypothetical protein